MPTNTVVVACVNSCVIRQESDLNDDFAGSNKNIIIITGEKDFAFNKQKKLVEIIEKKKVKLK